MTTEYPKPVDIPTPALLEDRYKVVFWVDMISARRGVHVVSEFRAKSGKIKRVSAWLDEDDSLQWGDENDDED